MVILVFLPLCITRKLFRLLCGWTSPRQASMGHGKMSLGQDSGMGHVTVCAFTASSLSWPINDHVSAPNPNRPPLCNCSFLEHLVCARHSFCLKIYTDDVNLTFPDNCCGGKRALSLTWAVAAETLIEIVDWCKLTLGSVGFGSDYCVPEWPPLCPTPHTCLLRRKSSASSVYLRQWDDSASFQPTNPCWSFPLF